jgi:putative membrane protein
VFGVVNAFVRPIAWVLTFPLILVTFGLFLLVINRLMLCVSTALGLGFHVSGFWAAFWGAAVVSIVGILLSALTKRHNPAD